MIEIKRNVPISIEPSIGEIANIIWSMDSDQQAFLLKQLAFKFQEVKMNGYIQMLAIAEDIEKIDKLQTYKIGHDNPKMVELPDVHELLDRLVVKDED